MTAPYEAEVRVYVPRIEDLRARFDVLGARRVESYAFTDRYCAPHGMVGRYQTEPEVVTMLLEALTTLTL